MPTSNQTFFQKFILFLLLSFIFSLTGCVSNKTNEIKIDNTRVTYGECDISAPTVITSSNNHIIIKFLINDHVVANKTAQSWCAKSNRIAKEEKYFCNGCCQSSYQCR